ncbi:hypothetical protein G9U51_08240 [Calidifontibacter sp. DB0510]|uniref:Uncharacterized protein n=1 Tax=Metallococcus carri TaxID=1656884 RepID=A0A967E8Y4_9MICO|nr:hypothetical protein [Metallococcus carri]NHN55757.1 hypothetical protein [Metallococcus carri]NHN55764.1 hypothetical protein [Metallococcus carri]NOP38547.1 hypothetical protein [Calidifontibacter sp. DB2511S]NOP38554.1 hypothetical protein [Calidifontibacter sp. DB2511S]
MTGKRAGAITWQRGGSRTRDLPAAFVRVLIIASMVQASQRALDYLTDPPITSTTYAIVEQLLTIQGWGWLIVASLTVLAVGMAGGWLLLRWLGHLMLALTYGTLMTGMYWQILSETSFPWDGLRGPGGLLLVFVLHALLAWRRTQDMQDAMVARDRRKGARQ